MPNPDPLIIWVIYDSPIDIPGQFVARKWFGEIPTQELLLAGNLDDLRNKLPPNLDRLARSPDDDLKIVEIWF